MSRPFWLNVGFILEVHSDQIAEHGGIDGIRDDGLLESAMFRPLNAFEYGEESILSLAALYAAGIIKNHPFLDGNKRTGFVASEVFLDINGFNMTATDEEALAAVLSLASGEWDDKDYANWLRDNTEAFA
jgi:death-on-curing protein